MEERPRNEQSEPDDEPKQAHDVHDGQSADAFFHELAEVGNHADGEEGQQEESRIWNRARRVQKYQSKVSARQIQRTGR